MAKSNIFIISGPSGAGEDSIINGLKKIFTFERIVSTTTRSMRPGEVNGINYYFISKDEFLSGIECGKFYEYVEEDGGNLYGVTKKEIDRVLCSDLPVIWKMEYKGVITIKKLLPQAIAILVDVPLEVIANRIRKRDGGSDEYINGRLEYAKGWYENKDKFDYLIKNDDGKLEEAIGEVTKIINRHGMQQE